MSHPTCVQCGGPIVGRRPYAIYCGPKCQQRSNYLAQKADGRRVKPKKPVTTRRCGECGGSFAAKRSDAKYCSQRCINRQSSRLGECSEPECERGTTARGMCSMHWKRWARANGLIKDAPWDDRRRDNYHARRARKRGSSATSAALLVDILERDGSDCAGCGLPVDLDLVWPDPMSKSVDHRIPLSRGGAHSLENTQLMHLRCNVSKGARVA